MRSVLLVSYTFPPQYDVSAKRAAKLCKYLPAAGWRPVVLTKHWTSNVASEDRRAYVLATHPKALDELADVTIVRTRYHTRDNALRRLHGRLGGAYATAPRSGSNEETVRVDHRPWTPAGMMRRALSLLSPTFGDFPDAFRGWVDTAVGAGVELVRRERIDAICSLCPPATAHVVAAEIARRTGVPWVPQFDDLFSFHLESEPRAPFRWYSSRAHRRWMRHASLAGAITPAMLSYVRRAFHVDGDVVMVGFDPDESPAAWPPHRDRFRLVYTGSVYLDNHRPELLFEALERVLSSRNANATAIEVVFAGARCDAELKRRVSGYPRAAAVCSFLERLPPDETLRLQREADALVLFNYTAAAAASGTLSFPAKSFEYLNAGRPILAVPSDPGGWGDRLLETTQAGVTADSSADAAAVLTRWLDEWRETGTLSYEGRAEQIAEYGQPRQAAILGRLLDRAVATRRHGAPDVSPARALR